MITRAVTVHYPSIMKMQMSKTFSVAEKDTLELFKQRVFLDFWDHFSSLYESRIGIHGTYESLRAFPFNTERVIHSNEEIKTTEVFQKEIENQGKLLISFNKTI